MITQFKLTEEEEELLREIKFNEKLKSKSNAIRFILNSYKEQLK